MELARPFFRHVSTQSPVKSLSRSAIRELHAHLIRTHMHTDSSSMFHVIKSYSLSPPTLHKALIAFHIINQPSLLIYNHLIRGLSTSENPIKAIIFYKDMCGKGLRGNNLSFIFVLKAVSRISDILIGGSVYVHVIKLGYMSYTYVCNGLIHMYAMCDDMRFAKRVFDEMPERDLVSWNSLICGFSQRKWFEEVLGLFDEMQIENVKGDSVTMVKVLLACEYFGDSDRFGSVVKYITDNRVEVDVYLGNTLICMYGRCGSIRLAREVFDQMVERNVVTWNSLIMAYTKNGDLIGARKIFDEMPKKDVISWTSMMTGLSQACQYAEVLGLFREMTEAMVKPDEVTASGVISACAHLGRLDMGEKVHNCISKHNMKMDICVANSLIDMYCKCGSVEKAIEVFEKMGEKDSMSWTSIISGLAVNGKANDALELFANMLTLGFRPTHGTFVGVLLACTHVGMVDKGLELFASMEKDFGLVPEMKHYGCVVDLLSRSGDLNRAFEFIKLMPIDPGVALWRIMLSGCKLHGDMVLGNFAKRKLLELDPGNGDNYVLSSLTYAGVDKWGEATKMRELVAESDGKKPFGWSSIEVNDVNDVTL